jgi:hypothetical protein
MTNPLVNRNYIDRQTPINADWLNGINDLQDTTGGTGGNLSFLYSVGYTAGTIGKWLKDNVTRLADLAETTGASLVGYNKVHTYQSNTVGGMLKNYEEFRDSMGEAIDQAIRAEAAADSAEASAAYAQVSANAAQVNSGLYASTSDALSNGVALAIVTAGGSGGTNGTFALTFSGGGGTGAAGTFLVIAGALESIAITNPGTGYTTAPTLSFAASMGLTGATATAVLAPRCPVGTYFSVPVTGSTDSLILYRVDTGPVATEITRYPSSAIGQRVEDLEGSSVFMAGFDPLLRPIRRLELFGADPSKIYRVRYFLRNDFGTRFSVTIQQVDNAAGDNPVDVCSFASSGVNYTGQQEFALAQVSSSGITGNLVLDFDAGDATWGIYAGATDTTLHPRAIVSSPAAAGYIGAVVAASPSIAALETRASNLESASDFVPGAHVALRVIKRLQLFGANTSKLYQLKNFFRNDVGTRFNITVQQVDDAAGTNPVDVCSFSSTGVNYAGLREFSLAQIASSGITGTAVVDFTAADTWGIYPASAATQLRADATQSSAASDDYTDRKIAAMITANSVLTAGLRLPFDDAMDNDALRAIVKELWVYGCDPSHDYAVTGFNIEQFPGITLTRILFTISDLTTGNIVCRYAYQVSSLPSLASFTASIPKQVKLTDSAIATKSGIYAVATLDLSSFTAWQANAYTTMAQAGISSRRTLSDEQISDYLESDYWHEVIRVGAGQTFTTLRSAVESLYIDTAASLFGCNRSHYHHRILIDLVDDGTYNATYLEIPEFVESRGNGVDRTFILKENDTHHAILEAHTDTKFRDCTIISDTGDGVSWNGEYSIHSDDSNRTTPGSKAQNRRLRQSFKRMKLIAGQNQNTWIFGCGISSGETIRFEDVIAEHMNVGTTAAAFGFHNTGPTISYPSISASYKPALVEMRGCRSPDSTPYGVYLQSLDPTTKSRLVLHGCEFGVVYQTVASGGEVVTEKAADRYGWEIGGVHAGPILQTDPDGMLVLGTTAGADVSGTAAAIIFGAVDELGRGELWIKTGTAKSLGARLGDCTSANKTLIIGGQTWTANQNYTAQSNATIMASINSIITSNPVEEVNIQYEIYPDTGFTRRMLNSTGASIPRGRFVKRTGANTIALATGDDDVFGWVYREIRNGYSGGVVTTKKAHTAYLAGASSDGKFGISNGVIDYAATPKKGYVVGGIVTTY